MSSKGTKCPDGTQCSEGTQCPRGTQCPGGTQCPEIKNDIKRDMMSSKGHNIPKGHNSSNEAWSNPSK